MKRCEKEKGFTLIEMLIVIFIIGLLITIALPNLKSAGDSARQKADEANRKLIGSQADRFYLENGSYPKSVKQLVDHDYLRSVPKCPWGDGHYIIQTDPSLPNDKRVTCKK